MDAVIKVGGSLAEAPEVLKALCVELSRLAKEHSVVVVPGGGKFADAAREYDKKFNLPPVVAHRLAIVAMDQYGIVLSQLISDSCMCNKREDAQRFSKAGKVPIFLPSRLMFQDGALETSWDVTSDSIAAYIAEKLSTKKVILVTDVDGVFTKDPKTHADAKLMPEISVADLLRREKRTSVDKYLPKILSKSHVACYVVNGKYPERIKDLLSGEQTICTAVKL